MKEDKSHFNEQWSALQKSIESVLTELPPNRMQILEDVFKASLKLAYENPGTLNLKIAATTLKELRFSFKMFYPHRFTPKITIFGSARVPADTPLYDQCKEFSRQAVDKGYMIMTGGGPGVMAAGNEGAQAKGSFGLNIRLPMEQDPNPFIDEDNNLIHYKYFFTRKLFLVKEASAFAFFPGGFGTFDECFEVLTLLQTGKTEIIPVVLLEPKGLDYWENLLEFVEKSMIKGGFISPSDMNLIKIFHSPEEAMAHIQEFYKVFHSMRYVKKNLVLRIRKPLSDKLLEQVNTEFASMARSPITQRGPLPEEGNESELKDLTRVVFEFDRVDYGNLRRLVDFINKNVT